MALMLWVKQAVKLLLLPPTGPLLLSLIGFAIARRRRRTGWTLALVGVAALTLLSIPAVGALLVRCLDRSPPLHLEDASGAQAIVIFGGGTRRYAPEYGGVTLATITLDRVRYGARIARATGIILLGDNRYANLRRYVLRTLFQRERAGNLEGNKDTIKWFMVRWILFVSQKSVRRYRQVLPTVNRPYLELRNMLQLKRLYTAWGLTRG